MRRRSCFPPPRCNKNAPGVEGNAVSAQRFAAGSARPIDTPTIELAATNDADIPVPTAALRTSNMMANPEISLTASTPHIPVNANRTNNSQWRTDGASPPKTLVGLPLIRDFDVNYPMRNLAAWNGIGEPPPGPAINDPEIKKMTAAVTPNGYMPMGPIQVFVIYADADNNGGGLVRLWQDQSKSVGINLTWNAQLSALQGSLPNYPTSDFYVEGIRPSKVPNDVKIKVKAAFMQAPGEPAPPPPAESEKTLTVTPVITGFSVNPKPPDPHTTFYRHTTGKIGGINSGRQSADGGDPNSGQKGAEFTADLIKTNALGRGYFIHNVIDLINGNPSAVELTNQAKANWTLPAPLSYPILDWVAGNNAQPFYPSDDVIAISPDRHNFKAHDTPSFFLSLAQLGVDEIVRFDLTFDAELYLVFRFDDGTVYTLARAYWQVIFKASMVNNALTIDQNSIVSAEPYHLTHNNPMPFTGPTFNTSIQLTPVP